MILRHLVCALRLFATLVLMLAGAVVLLKVALLTAFQFQRFYRETLNAELCRLILRVWGIRVLAHGAPKEAGQPVIYLSNHSSTLDMFVLSALALPNTRHFMSGWLRRLPPFAVIGYLTGIIWTARQWYPEHRTRIFTRAEALLRRTRESVYLSPEGTRVATGEIGHFNKGAFHLATNLKWPIVPFLIVIPPEVDPGMGVCARSGVVQVHFKPPIDTSDWRLDRLLQNKEAVRDRFVEWHREHHG